MLATQRFVNLFETKATQKVGTNARHIPVLCLNMKVTILFFNLLFPSDVM